MDIQLGVLVPLLVVVESKRELVPILHRPMEEPLVLDLLLSPVISNLAQ